MFLLLQHKGDVNTEECHALTRWLSWLFGFLKHVYSKNMDQADDPFYYSGITIALAGPYSFTITMHRKINEQLIIERFTLPKLF